MVILDFERYDTYFINVTVNEEYSKLTHLDTSVFESSIEYDNDGHVIRLIVYVHDEALAMFIKTQVVDYAESCK